MEITDQQFASSKCTDLRGCKNFFKSYDVRMYELSVVYDFSIYILLVEFIA